MRRINILTICSTALAAGIFLFKEKEPTTIASGSGLVVPKEWLLTNTEPLTPEADRRPADQTFLTFPEWFLVFSPQEQADYFKQHTSTSFPFMSHTAQIWQSYSIVKDQIRGNFPENKGYHLMIWVIGLSASAEYSAKAGYETIIGRITDTGAPMASEDRFNAHYAADYVAFIRDRPWYEFDFKSQLKCLWTSTGFQGDHPIRKIERKYMLTSELLVKCIYGKLIGLGTEQVYDAALPTTSVVLDDDSVRYLPRYDNFASAAIALAESGRSFKEIAGNNSAILLTVLVPTSKAFDPQTARTVFTQVITTDPTRQRIALATPVTSLSALLTRWSNDDVVVEHVFDY